MSCLPACDAVPCCHARCQQRSTYIGETMSLSLPHGMQGEVYGNPVAREDCCAQVSLSVPEYGANTDKEEL